MRLSSSRSTAILHRPQQDFLLWDKAGTRPSLDQQFADRKDLVDTISGQQLITFTRASAGTYVGSDGLIKTATTNEARFDHDPGTGESLGLLVEEQRTNGIRNNMMAGASAPSTIPTNWNTATSAAGISFEVVGVGAESGITYIDIRQHGTPSANGSTQISLEQNTTNAAASGETWIISSYCRLMAGTLPGFTVLLARIGGSGGSFLTSSQATIAPTGSSLISQRFTHVAALSNASTEYITARIDTAVFSGVPVDFTLRIGMPQLEKGAFATSVIPTTGSTVTRAADVASITGANFSSWYRQDEGTIYYLYKPFGVASGRRTFSLDDGTVDNQYRGAASNSSGTSANYIEITSGGVNQGFLGTGNAYTETQQSGAFAYILNNAGFSKNGSTASLDSSVLIPTINTLNIGSDFNNTAVLNGHIRRITYWPVRLENNVLQTITQ